MRQSVNRWMKGGVLACLCLSLVTAMTVAAHGESTIQNILLIVSDDLKASVLGCYGDKVCKTPNIDKLAASGMVFERAYCQGTWCAPSRQSFMHSRYKGKAELNLGRHLRDEGVFSARVGKIYHMRVPGDIIAGTHGGDVENTWDERYNSAGQEAHTPGDYACLNLNIFTTELEGRESTQMKNRAFVTVSYEGDGSDQPDHKTATKMIELMRAHKAKRFFLAAGFVRPHYPMVAPKRYFDMYPWEDIVLPEETADDLADIPKTAYGHIRRNGNDPIGRHPDNQKRMWAGYYASVTFMDDQVGRMLDELDVLGLRESTAIVFISDHGYHLGEHTFWQKTDLHEDVVRVPMVISVPGMKAGSTRSITELVDIYPTLTELMGVSTPGSVQGVSLLPVLASPDKSVRESALSFARSGTGLRSAGWAYMRYRGGEEELYNMRKDPKQFTNVAGNPEYAAVLKLRRAAMEERLTAAGIGKSQKK